MCLRATGSDARGARQACTFTRKQQMQLEERNMIRRSFVHRFGLLAIGATLCATTALAGCAPGSNSESGAQSQSGTAEVSTDVAAAGKVTLNLTDSWSGTEGEWIEKMVSNFEAKYPNVTINREAQDWNQLNSTLNLRLQEDSS